MGNFKHIIGVDTLDDDVKAYCIMDITNGFVVVCDSIKNDEDKFWEEVEKSKKFYNAIEIKDFDLKTTSEKVYSKIPNISEVINKFVLTEKGKELIKNYLKDELVRPL